MENCNHSTVVIRSYYKYYSSILILLSNTNHPHLKDIQRLDFEDDVPIPRFAFPAEKTASVVNPLKQHPEIGNDDPVESVHGRGCQHS